MANIPAAMWDYMHPSRRDDVEDALEAYKTMERILSEFKSALVLFDVAVNEIRARRQVDSPMNAEQFALRMHIGRWPFIATKEGAMLIYDFKHALEAVKAGIYRSPILKDKVERDLIQKAENHFRAHFPHWKKIRNALGHTGEIHSSRKAWSENGLNRPLSTPLIRSTPGNAINAIQGRTLSVTTFGGEFVSYEMSEETLSHLWLIYAMLFEALNDDGSGKPQNERLPATYQKLREFER